ncbi:MAG: glycosyltransferase family 4 protein [Bdellovibrionales bacterium]|nr:glycosyltransferase family 4 protein [Bdellovibrionales bacterium]
MVSKISEGLVKLGHEVHVATSFDSRRVEKKINGVTVHQFKISGNSVSGLKWGEVNHYIYLLTQSDFDIVVVFAMQQWATDIALAVIDQIKAHKVIVPTGYSALYDPRFQRYYEELPAILKKFDKVIYHSKEYRDYFFGLTCGIENGIIIPNGASQEEFSAKSDFNLRQFLRVSPEAKVLLTVGNHTGTKGHADCFSIFSEIVGEDIALVILGEGYGADGCIAACTKKARLFNLFPWIKFSGGKAGIVRSFIAGVFSPRSWFSKKSIHLLSLPRPQVIEAFKQSDLFVFLSQIECYPIVLIEAMAAGLPILCSEAGASYDIVNSSQSGWVVPSREHIPLVRNDIKVATELLAKCLERKDLADVGERGRSYWEKNQTWEVIVNMYNDLYLEIGK